MHKTNFSLFCDKVNNELCKERESITFWHDDDEKEKEWEWVDDVMITQHFIIHEGYSVVSNKDDRSRVCMRWESNDMKGLCWFYAMKFNHYFLRARRSDVWGHAQLILDAHFKKYEFIVSFCVVLRVNLWQMLLSVFMWEIMCENMDKMLAALCIWGRKILATKILYHIRVLRKCWGKNHSRRPQIIAILYYMRGFFSLLLCNNFLWWFLYVAYYCCMLLYDYVEHSTTSGYFATICWTNFY